MADTGGTPTVSGKWPPADVCYMQCVRVMNGVLIMGRLCMSPSWALF